MIGRRIRLAKLFGFEVDLDFSWLILGTIIFLSLAWAVFPHMLPDYPPLVYWLMALVTVAGVIVSIVLHELSHSLVARRFGIRIRRITLFLFGGVAQIEGEPDSPRAEFWIAIVGPVTSVAIAGVLYLAAAMLGESGDAPLPTVLHYLAVLNLVLAAFNMVPAFPLDGGRVLRAGLWAWRGDLIRATQWASLAGSAFGLLLAFLGGLILLNGVLGGVWWILIGLFIRGSAQNAYRMQLVESQVSARTVAEIMEQDIEPVPGYWPLSAFLAHHGRLYRAPVFPVLDFGGRPIGLIDVREARQRARQDAGQRVDRLMEPLSEANVVDADLPAREALQRLVGGQAALAVVTGGVLQGMIYLDDFTDSFVLDRAPDLRRAP